FRLILTRSLSDGGSISAMTTRLDRVEMGPYYHAASRWTTVRDRDHDILAGRYLDVDEQIQAGVCFAIDDFQIVVRECVQEGLLEEESIELVDLASDSESAAPKPNIGGRVWVLADDADADEEGEGGCILSDETEPNAIMHRYDSGLVRDPAKGHQEKKVLDQKTEGHGKSLSMKIKPWKGPIPKVCLPPHTLSDYFSSDGWTRVTRKKKKHGVAASKQPPG
uniref:Uncharacterized protein n=1 Tax=Aegilops tauschii subsp. strangulata TaxID=200361 RepID=A0A453K3J6_AEGTS